MNDLIAGTAERSQMTSPIQRAVGAALPAGRPVLGQYARRSRKAATSSTATIPGDGGEHRRVLRPPHQRVAPAPRDRASRPGGRGIRPSRLTDALPGGTERRFEEIRVGDLPGVSRPARLSGVASAGLTEEGECEYRMAVRLGDEIRYPAGERLEMAAMMRSPGTRPVVVRSDGPQAPGCGPGRPRAAAQPGPRWF